VDKFAKETDGAMSGLGAKLTAIFSVGFFVNAIRGAVNFADALQDTSDALNISAESLQGLQGAFAQAGVGQEQFRSGMSKLNQSVQDARDGNEKMIGDFARLGVTWKDIRDKSPEEILYLIADGMKNSKDPTEALASAMSVLGKAGKSMAAELRQGGDALKSHASEVSKLSDEEVAAVGALADAWTGAANAVQVYLDKAVAGMTPSKNPSAGSMAGDFTSGVKNLWQAAQRGPGKLWDLIDGEKKPGFDPGALIRERKANPSGQFGPGWDERGFNTGDGADSPQDIKEADRAHKDVQRVAEINLDLARTTTEEYDKQQQAITDLIVAKREERDQDLAKLETEKKITAEEEADKQSKFRNNRSSPEDLEALKKEDWKANRNASPEERRDNKRAIEKDKRQDREFESLKKGKERNEKANDRQMEKKELKDDAVPKAVDKKENEGNEILKKIEGSLDKLVAKIATV